MSRRPSLALAGRIAAAAALSLAAWLVPGAARASDASVELVREARAHESAHEDDVAARRYIEAIEIDPTNGDA